MKLFVFEGEKREPDIFRALQTLFFAEEKEMFACSYGNNIYQLYRELREYDHFGDVVALLKAKVAGRAGNDLKEINNVSDVSEVYLFFDYDPQNKNLTIAEMNSQLADMLAMFNNETEEGKLYINYPMVEAIRYTKQLPDSSFWEYTVGIEDCGKFKEKANMFSAYGNLDFIMPRKRNDSAQMSPKHKENWNHLIEQNVAKACYICRGKVEVPASKDDILQSAIFEGQCNKYIANNLVAILSAFPLFLFDYFPQNAAAVGGD